ncbi:MAG TPA: DoxX family protein [Nitrospiria bacterium]|nr:DoxX family protein [Nitrospiria bacterium]
MNSYVMLIGRVLVASIFVLSGISKIGNFSGTSQFMASKGLPASDFLLVMTIIIEVLGGISIIFGYKAKWGAWALFVFMIPVTLVFHTNFADQNQMIHFLKNISMMGGLLYIASAGSGPLSLEEKMKK